MKKRVLVIVAAVAAACVIVSDLSHRRSAAAVVDRLYLNFDGQLDAQSAGLLGDAEKALDRHARRMLILPASSVRNALMEVQGQLFDLNLKKEHVDKLLSEMTDDDAAISNQVKAKIVKQERDSYAARIPEFKSKLGYIRRTL